MDFTFGIITNNGQYVESVINSIIDLNIDIGKYEIIVVGNLNKKIENINFIEYVDDSKHFSISVKKNIITDNSKFENIVYLHDYVSFDKNWYNGFLNFGNDFDVCMTRMVNKDGNRFRDWCLWKDDGEKFLSTNNFLIPYSIKNLSSMMYISGSYWIAKKKFMIENRLNEKLKWNQGEDVEWSIRVRNKTDFKINIESCVNLLKQKDRIFNETTLEENLKLSSIEKYDNINSYDDLIKNHLSKWL